MRHEGYDQIGGRSKRHDRKMESGGLQAASAGAEGTNGPDTAQ